MSAPQENFDRAAIWARYVVDLLGIALLLGIGAWAYLKAPGTPGPVSAVERPAGSGTAAPQNMPPCVINSDGYLTGRLYGALKTTIVWHGVGMTCDGMVRPNKRGIRLVFASEEFGQDERLVFVIGIDGEPANLAGEETKANITIIDEGSGRFFSAGGQDRCWTTVRSVEPAEDQGTSTYQVRGDLYCATALPSLNGKGSVTLGEFRYSGRLVVDEP